MEYLGAGITPEDFELNLYPDIWIPAKNRNEGLIQVTEDQIKYAENWAESLVVIDIVKKTIDFDAFFYHDDLEEAEEKEAIKMDLPWNMPYDDFLVYADWIRERHKVGQYYWNGEQYCSFIE